jgi:SAM-dependent methyltransferase
MFTILLKESGLYPKNLFYMLKGFPVYLRNKSLLKKQLKETNAPFKITRLYPQLTDRYDTTGSFPLHYFYQDLYVAQRVFNNSSLKHVDIGSRIDGFVTHVASFRKIEVIDIREIKGNIPNVSFLRADLMSNDFNLHDYCDSVSCLHTIEHFGLGRYGDSVDVNGHLKGLKNITNMLKKNGRLYISTVIGPQRIEFDAHRVFSVKYLIDLIENDFTIANFSYIDEKNKLHVSAELSEKNIQNNFLCSYGCGIFELIKK